MHEVSYALRWLARQVDDPTPPADVGSWLNRCLQLTRTAAGLPFIAPEADQALRLTPNVGPAQARPAAGMILWWDRPGHPATDHDAGHVAMSAGEGLCYSNDVRRRGRVDLVRVADISRTWGMPRVGDSRYLGPYLFVPDPDPDPETRPRRVTVARGDTLSGLVAEHLRVKGVTWRDVWLDPHNRGLRAKRGRPERIRPGDKLWVP